MTVTDSECVVFLQWALPRLRMRWPGFRRVRRQVCRRISRHIAALGLPDVAAYRALLESNPEEWGTLDPLCRITISRFYRDRGVFDVLRAEILPALAELAIGRGDEELRGWCTGCGSGEEVYTLKALWELDVRRRFPRLRFDLTGSDIDAHCLERARLGRYRPSSLRELPAAWRASMFEPRGEELCIRPEFREGIEFRLDDVRESRILRLFHLILCRNVAFTYFDDSLQLEVARRLAGRTVPGGALVLGAHESLPPGVVEFDPWIPRSPIYRRRPPHERQ